MTAPDNAAERTDTKPRAPQPMALATLKKRSDFLKAARGRRASTPSFILQARKREASEADTVIRVGYTCSKRVGNAVARNRAKRRLRALARATLAGAGRPGWDYVLIGRANATEDRPFDELRADLKDALHRIHGASR